MSARINRRALAAGLLAATAVPAASKSANLADLALRGDDTARLPDHAAFWSRLPLPFSLAEAWHKLSPATQAEIGTAVLGMALAQYVYGDGRAEADQFTDEDLRADASDVADDLLNRIDDRLWVLLPDLYGPDGDHPAWAYTAGMVYPLGTVLPDPEPAPAPAVDPIFSAIEAADVARQAHQAAHVGLDEDDDAQMARLGELVDADRAAFEALAEIVPTTRRGDVALADFYLRTLDDPDGQATAHLEHLRAVLADAA
ncbi:hypothetical protein MKK84_05480 [Methylobacterium sp. E-065]|uniref:hypothetical protein n=1 Tax=Methylobacterium sp. E-065 TaxID=2836583 RepID=UPI001FBBC2AE|nr:hypothetical protein [Methylobacterium sp. E-065]MCJ2016883.1 hypothetical protein [Methylobacterium sp. E-065]